MNTPIDRLMDAMYCDRWSMVGTTEPSNVATHSFNVAMIAMAIRKKMRNTISFSEQEVAYYALIHDVKEVYTGDIPTPTKAKMREAGFDPETFDPEVPDEKSPPDIVRAVVKMADLIDNYVFISEHGQGSRARSALSEVSGRLHRAIDEAPADLQAAARDTLNYILGRRSEQGAERKRIEEDAERLRQIKAHFTFERVVGGEPLDQPRNPGLELLSGRKGGVARVESGSGFGSKDYARSMDAAAGCGGRLSVIPNKMERTFGDSAGVSGHGPEAEPVS